MQLRAARTSSEPEPDTQRPTNPVYRKHASMPSQRNGIAFAVNRQAIFKSKPRYGPAAFCIEQFCLDCGAAREAADINLKVSRFPSAGRGLERNRGGISALAAPQQLQPEHPVTPNGGETDTHRLRGPGGCIVNPPFVSNGQHASGMRGHTLP